ncbi:MAG TPA: hypothetical protein PKA09_13975 [Geminicoccus sp.]|nr:hypothetical protein [Geminicoccus sp.]
MAVKPTDDTTTIRSAIVVFEHRPFRGPLRLLRPGFRHCFCLLRTEEQWLLCDPLKGSLRLELLPPYAEEDLARHYIALGRHALLGPITRRDGAGGLGLRPLSCVEIVKRAIGLAAPGVLTPYQLYRKLNSTPGWYLWTKFSLDP